MNRTKSVIEPDKFLDDLITGLQKEWRAKDEQLATAQCEIERLQYEVRELRDVIRRGAAEFKNE